MTKTLSILAALTLVAGVAHAQTMPDVFLRGVPSGLVKRRRPSKV